MPTSRRAGGISKRCECRGPDGKRLGAQCPDLSKRAHGKYRVHQELPPDDEGARRRFQRTGYATAKDAQADLDKVRAILDLAGEDEADQRRVGDLLAALQKDRGDIPDVAEVQRKLGVGVPLDGKMTVGDWLDKWAAGKKTRITTTKGYRSHIRVHLKPAIGHHRLDRLTVGHCQAMFDAIAEANEVIAAENEARREQQARATWGKRSRPPVPESARLAAERAKLAGLKPYRRLTGPGTQQGIKRTLRAALNGAITAQLITFNPAAHVEIEGGKRPKGLLWTAARVARWRETSEIPGPVMVWTPQQIGDFLDAAESSRLYALFHLIAFRGLRRGEGVGVPWANVDLDAQELTIATEIIVGEDHWTPVEDVPKTEDSAATIGLDSLNVRVLREHRERQAKEKETAGEKWVETGKVFTTEVGEWLHPEKVSDEFRRVIKGAALPPINLRDLRHCAATLIHKGSGGDIHAVKEVLRHSSIQLTSNTYTALLKEVDLEIAEKAAALVPRARKPETEPAAPAL